MEGGEGGNRSICLHSHRRLYSALGHCTTNSLTHHKSLCVSTIQQRPRPPPHLLFLDGDVTLFRSPLPFFQRWAANVAAEDALFMDDTNLGASETNLNSGFFTLRSSNRTRRFWRLLLQRHCDDPTHNDQVHLNELLQQEARHSLRGEASRKSTHVASTHDKIRVGVLPTACFPNGFHFYAQRPRSAGYDVRCIVAVHHNFIRGDAHKTHRAAQYGALARPEDDLAHFLARANDTMRSMPIALHAHCT